MRAIALLLAAAAGLAAQDGKIRVIAFGAHPDDCDIRAAGTAALFSGLGHAVKFVAVTNGDVGHQSLDKVALAKRRLGEAKESARRLGIEYEVLNNHDGELLPTLEVREVGDHLRARGRGARRERRERDGDTRPHEQHGKGPAHHVLRWVAGRRAASSRMGARFIARACVTGNTFL